MLYTVKPVLRGPSKRRPKLIIKTDCRLMQVKSIAECSKGSILQYFQPSLSYHLSLRPLFCLFLSDRLRPVLLYQKSLGVLLYFSVRIFEKVGVRMKDENLILITFANSLDPDQDRQNVGPGLNPNSLTLIVCIP